QAVGHRRATRTHRLHSQARDVATEGRGKVARLRHRMIGPAELEVHAGVIAVWIGSIVLPLRVAAIAYAYNAVVEILWPVGAVAMAREADFVLVGGAREEGVPHRLPASAHQCSAHLRRLSRRLVTGEVRIMAVHALGVAGGAGGGFGQRVKS